MLAGNYTSSSRFADDDHRNYNRDGSHFDVGETFSGVDYTAGLEAAAAFGSLAASLQGNSGSTTPATTAQTAIAWVSQLEGVATVIPGARSASQARANAAAGSLPELGSSFDDGVRSIYDAHFRAAIHPRW